MPLCLHYLSLFGHVGTLASQLTRCLLCHRKASREKTSQSHKFPFKAPLAFKAPQTHELPWSLASTPFLPSLMTRLTYGKEGGVITGRAAQKQQVLLLLLLLKKQNGNDIHNKPPHRCLRSEIKNTGQRVSWAFRVEMCATKNSAGRSYMYVNINAGKRNLLLCQLGMGRCHKR